MNWINKILLLLVALLLSSCRNKEVTNTSAEPIGFVQSLEHRYHLKLDRHYPLFMFYIMPYDCNSCMYDANDFLKSFLTDSLTLPHSNIMFLLPTISTRDFKYLRKEYYTFDFTRYRIVKSDSLSDVVASKYGKPIGAMLYVIDHNDSLLYRQALKHILYKDTLQKFLVPDTI